MKALLIVAGLAIVLALALFFAFGRRGGSGAAVAPAIGADSHDRAPASVLENAPEPARSTVEPAVAQMVLAGIVRDFAPGTAEEGTPAAGAGVRGYEGLASHSIDLAPVQTDAQGRFRFEFADPGRRPLHFVLVSDETPTLRPAMAKRDLQGGATQVLDLVLARYPKGDLVGVTVDPRDVPVSKAHLKAHFSQDTRETDSDEEGRFRFRDAGSDVSLDFLEAEREGYLFLHAPRPVQMPRGGWEPMKVVLAPTARLVVRVVDDQGRGIEGRSVSPAVSPWEKAGRRRVDFDSRAGVSGVTGVDGRVALDAVWAEQRLSITVSPPPEQQGVAAVEFAREHEGQLLPERAIDGLPIVLRPGEQRELTAKLAPALRIEGRVVDEAGRPVSPAYVDLLGSWESADAVRLRMSDQTDGEGRFVFEVSRDRAIAFVQLKASDKRTFIVHRGTRAASCILDLGQGPPKELVLVLKPGLNIAGHVLAPDGAGVAGQVFAGADVPDERDVDWRGWSMVSKDGSFSVEGLAAGAYELWARPNDKFGEVRVHGIDAGREDVTLNVPAQRAAHVTIEIRVRDAEADKLYVLNGRIVSRTSTSEDAPELPAQAEYSEPGGWPRSAVGLLYGGGGYSDEHGTISYSITPTKSLPVELDLDEGLNWLGAKGIDRDGRTLLPIGTGLVRVGAGSHRLIFELAPAVPIEGRIVGADVLDLAVGVARGSKLLELDPGHGDLCRTRPVGADGSFTFVAVPVGENELWIGSAADLAAGRPTRRHPLVVDPKGVPFLEIDVGR